MRLWRSCVDIVFLFVVFPRPIYSRFLLRFEKLPIQETLFKAHGGILHTAQALRVGSHPGTLYGLRDSGVLEVVSRGVYLSPPKNYGPTQHR